MAQNLLAALGARIEAQLKGRHTRHRSIEDDVKAKISINPPAPFALLSDDAGQFGYLPGVAERAIPVTRHGADAEARVPNLTPETFPSAADISAAIAPFAALFTNSAQVLIEPVTSTSAPTPAIVAAAPAEPMDVMTAATEPNLTPATSAPATSALGTSALGTSTLGTSVPVTPVPPTPVATPKVAATPIAATPASATPTATAPAVATPPVAAPAAANSAAANAAAAAARVLPPGATVLPDGTIIANLVPNVMPAVPAEFGIGATVRRKGVHSDVPMTVTVDYNGIIRATVSDSAGTRTFESPWDQFELVTRAPGS